MQFIREEIKKLKQEKLKDNLNLYGEGRLGALTWVLEKLEEPAVIHDIEEGPLQSTWNVIDRQEFEQLKRQVSTQLADLQVKQEQQADTNAFYRKVLLGFQERLELLEKINNVVVISKEEVPNENQET